VRENGGKMSCNNGNETKLNNSVIFSIIGLLTAGVIICYLFVDEPVFSWLRQNPQRFNLKILETAFEQLGKVFAIIWLLLFWVWITGRHKTVITGLLALIITIPAVWSVKAAVRRPRPNDVIKAEAGIESRSHQTDKWSFPSGDTASVCAIGTVLAMVARWPGTSAVIICCAGIGVFRVLDLAHYPSDVLGEAALGIFCGWAAVRMKNRNPKIENIFGGAEQLLSFIGIFSIPLLVWLFQGQSKLSILLTFYTPVAIIISLIGWKLNKQGKTEQAYSDKMRRQGN
jgi:membrane-associated phospholipid phosphatase